jgi:hypothetical protein
MGIDNWPEAFMRKNPATTTGFVSDESYDNDKRELVQTSRHFFQKNHTRKHY